MPAQPVTALICEDQTKESGPHIFWLLWRKKMQKNKAEVGQIFLFLLGLFIWFLLAESMLNSGLTTHGKWLMKLQGPVGIIVRWVWILTLTVTTSVSFPVVQHIFPFNRLLLHVGKTRRNPHIIIFSGMCL